MPENARQLRLYQDTCDIYETTVPITSGVPGDEVPAKIATGVRYYHQTTVNLFELTTVGNAYDADVLTTDKAHFPYGTPLRGTSGHDAPQYIVNTTPGSEKNGTYVVLGPAQVIPSAGGRRANKLIVMVRAQDEPVDLP